MARVIVGVDPHERSATIEVIDEREQAMFPGVSAGRRRTPAGWWFARHLGTAAPGRLTFCPTRTNKIECYDRLNSPGTGGNRNRHREHMANSDLATLARETITLLHRGAAPRHRAPGART